MSRPIVSSAHLVSEGAAELSEFEFGLIIASNAFDRWVVRCMAAAGQPELGALDVMVLHSVNHRNRAKKLADLCFVLNVEDTHTVSYALKKLVRLGLVQAAKSGKEALYGTTPAGRAACARYREVREACLVNSLSAFAGGGDEQAAPQSEAAQDPSQEIGAMAALLRALSGLYDQAARAAASL
ncbi:MAG: winged helix DNA-binding protein [Rhodospirillales bacterium]|nr:winged helix DNA-binding protein [Rhodospirillales bacterium]